MHESAQRGVRRNGKQRNLVRNYVAEMGNNLWPSKYKAFGKLEDAAQRQYWATIFAAYKAVYAANTRAFQIDGEKNPADVLTKYKSRADFALHQAFLMGYPEKALRIWRASAKYRNYKPKKIVPVSDLEST